MKSFTLSFVLVLPFVHHALASQTHTKLVDIAGSAFYDEFTFDTAKDPTHGRVYVSISRPLPILIVYSMSLFSTYVDQHTAQEHNITHATDNSFVLRADYTTYLTPSDPGRRSARIVSRRQFTTVVAVYVGQLGVIRHTIPDYICIASTYFTCHKDAGELLLNGLVMLMCLIKYI